MKCFVHPGDIHPLFALAVHAVLHNNATWETWDILDKEYEEVSETLAAITRIYKENNQPWTDRERSWWSKELTGKKEVSCG